MEVANENLYSVRRAWNPELKIELNTSKMEDADKELMLQKFVL